MNRPTASHPEARPETPCGQDCTTCNKADGCSAALSILAQILTGAAADDGLPAGDAAWK